MPRSYGFTGGTLPKERHITLTALHYLLPRVRNDPKFNHNRMSFGQFIAHDISLTPTGSKSSARLKNFLITMF